jgi:hypothetical protein
LATFSKKLGNYIQSSGHTVTDPEDYIDEQGHEFKSREGIENFPKNVF